MGNPDSDSLTESDKKDEFARNSAFPRESLIKTAVTFLSDKKIQNQDPKLLRQFLLKKGLTEEEASAAFQRVEAAINQNLGAEYGQPASRVQPFVPALAPLPAPPPPVPSFWHTVNSVVTTITSIGGIVYALYWLWKKFISPYLFGRKPKKKPVEQSLADLEASVNTCVTEMNSIRSTMQTLADQRAVELTQTAVVTRIQEVKSEVNSLKSLLLNRSQFPATPPPLGPSPLSIPAWQLSAETTAHSEQEAEGEGEEEGSGSNGTTNGSDSSLEIVKDPTS